MLHGVQRLIAPALVRGRPLLPAAQDPRTTCGVSITLVSYPARFPTLSLTLRSLLRQSCRPDQVVLCLHTEDLGRLPGEVLDLLPFGLRILPYPEDLGFYLKVSPALRQQPDRTWVTADDDVYYPPGWLAELRTAHRADPHAVIARRTHLMRVDADGRLASYGRWQRQTDSLHLGDPHFLTGIGGVLYPPGSLHAHALDARRFLALSPGADDIWLNWMVRMQGTPIHRVGDNREPVTWLRSQKVGLYRKNARAGGNDKCITAMLRTYGPDCLHARAPAGVDECQR